MVTTNGNGTYPYPSNGWSTGKIRKRGEKREGEYDVAMDVQRRGQPQIGSPEWEQAGALAARGGVTRGAGALSPDVIQQHKSQIQAMTNQWELGTIDWNKYHREIRYKGWEVLWAPIDLMPTGGPIMTRRDILLQSVKQDIAPAFKAKSKEELKEISDNPKSMLGQTGQAIGKSIKEGLKGGKSFSEIKKDVENIYREGMTVKLKDPNGDVHSIPLDTGFEE